MASIRNRRKRRRYLQGLICLFLSVFFSFYLRGGSERGEETGHVWAAEGRVWRWEESSRDDLSRTLQDGESISGGQETSLRGRSVRHQPARGLQRGVYPFPSHTHNQLGLTGPLPACISSLPAPTSHSMTTHTLHCPRNSSYTHVWWREPL